MEKLEVIGAKKLKGTVKISGSKNSSLPILAATLLSNKKVKLLNLPRVKDIETMILLLRSLGSNVKYNKKKPQKNMDYIDYGLTIVRNSIFSDFPSNEVFDLADVFENLSDKSLLAGFEIYDRFYEIGSINGLNDTIEFFKKNGKK